MATPNELPTAVHKLDSLMVYLVGMILVRMGKKKMRRENMRENGWEEGREKSGGARRFSPQPTKTQSTPPQNLGEYRGGNSFFFFFFFRRGGK